MEPNNPEQEALIASANEAKDRFRATLADLKLQATETPEETTDEEVL